MGCLGLGGTIDPKNQDLTEKKNTATEEDQRVLQMKLGQERANNHLNGQILTHN